MIQNSEIEKTILILLEETQTGCSLLDIIKKTGRQNKAELVLSTVRSLEERELIVQDGDKFHIFETE